MTYPHVEGGFDSNILVSYTSWSKDDKEFTINIKEGSNDGYVVLARGQDIDSNDASFISFTYYGATMQKADQLALTLKDILIPSLTADFTGWSLE